MFSFDFNLSLLLLSFLVMLYGLQDWFPNQELNPGHGSERLSTNRWTAKELPWLVFMLMLVSESLVKIVSVSF